MTAQAIQNIRTRFEWAEIISADWRKSIESIIQTGRDLIAAKGEIPKGEFQKMIKTDLPFGETTTWALIRIAKHPAIANRHPVDDLPPSWAVLGELASLSAEDFQDAQERGLIGGDTSKRKAIAIRKAYKGQTGGAIGEGTPTSNLPSPKEAKEVARATNRLVAASDGRFYSGTTDEEGAEYVRRRDQTYGVIDAIDAIVNSGLTPQEWCKEVKPHWLNRFEYGRIEIATKWLDGLRLAFMRQRLVHDCEVEADGE